MPKTVNVMDAARMTANRTAETASRVRSYFGDAGPFSYGKVRTLTAPILSGELPFGVVTDGINKIKFDLARNCNLDVAKLLAKRTEFNGRTFYPLKQLTYRIDKDFSVGIRPETVAVVDGVPNLIFLQPRKTPTPWPLNVEFMNRVLTEVYEDYFENAKFWLIDTEAPAGEDRQCQLIDLSSVIPMEDREFRRRIASLRQAWRLHLSTPSEKAPRPNKPDDRQSDFDLDG